MTAFWEAVYRRAFPDFAGMLGNVHNNVAQRLGVDRLVWLHNGSTLRIDEKVRETGNYPDVLLEYRHEYEDGRTKEGWILKQLQIDYLAYAVLARHTAYILPWQPLRAAWYANRQHWLTTFETKRAENAKYTTLSVAVPIDTLRQSLWSALVVDNSVTG